MRQHLFPMYYGYRFADSPIADWLSEFSQWLATAQYCTAKQHEHVAIVRHVLEREQDLPEDRRFDAQDLERMFRSRVRPRSFAATRWAFEHYLRAQDRWVTVLPNGPHQSLLDAFGAHMRDLQGLALATIDQKHRVASAFLALCCTPPRTLAELTPHDVERFIARRARRVARSTLQSTVGYLRAFLRFCQERGACAPGLDDIDRPRRFRDEKPPRAIPWELALQLLASIDRDTRMGCRDHAMLYLMTHYGLRTGEAGGLQLTDVDLRARVLCVSQPKVRATLTLPLSQPALRVLARYVQYGRPRTHRPELFLSVNAPLAPVTRGAIAEMFRRHVHRSGLPLTGYSPYGLRHGFAMRLLERGVGITTIGDLLGHHTLESTAVYLRLNTEALRDVALPVPTRVRNKGSAS